MGLRPTSTGGTTTTTAQKTPQTGVESPTPQPIAVGESPGRGGMASRGGVAAAAAGADSNTITSTTSARTKRQRGYETDGFG